MLHYYHDYNQLKMINIVKYKQVIKKIIELNKGMLDIIEFKSEIHNNYEQ